MPKICPGKSSGQGGIRVVKTLTAPARGVHDKANILADAWSPILLQTVANPSLEDSVAGWIDRVDNTTQILTDTANVIITVVEIERALRECQDGKASGPDRLGNSWDRIYADQLIPILEILLNKWCAEGVFPVTFLEDDMFCFRKSDNPHNALNYRPTALLDTDYKIATRILATRVQETLDERIHLSQNAFVPGRTIHATLDIYAAAQKVVSAGLDQSDALVMLLDFRKTYDSLSRAFLIKALRRHGFLEQGCPLAPLFFILALDALYQELDRHPELRGVLLRSAAGEAEIWVAGYADDTAVYLVSPSAVPVVLQITETFGGASGLCPNHTKKMVVALSQQGPPLTPSLPPPLQFQPGTERQQRHHPSAANPQTSARPPSQAIILAKQTSPTILSWRHHVRSFNKMADFLADQAMDSRRSRQQQPIRVLSSASEWDPLYAYATGDVGHWIEQNTDENSSGFVVWRSGSAKCADRGVPLAHGARPAD
ncbi:hypothetical protein ON010_g17789 [Phytophthora cinnamomi]|nr:hypothetical protein ON010_g17789 [Phytophthora cinnamomi]